MNAVVIDDAVVGETAFVAAMAFVKAGIVIPPRTLVAGIPARVVRALTDHRARLEGRGHAELPGILAKRSLRTMEAVAPLAAPEPGRKRIDLPEMLPLSDLKAR